MPDTSAKTQTPIRSALLNTVRKAVRAGLLLSVLALLVGLLDACGSSSDSGGVKIGTTEAGSDSWKTFIAEAKKQGINLVSVNFSDYAKPNDALAQKQIDVNLFQHLRFLADYNVAHKANLAPVASTYIVPLGLYSTKHKSVAELPPAALIAVPKDPSNLARALFVLRAAGLVTLKGNPWSPTDNDIDKEHSKVTVKLVDPAFASHSLDSADGAFINNNYLSAASIDPDAALLKDDPSQPEAQPYINVIVTRAEDKDNPLYKKLAEVYHSQPVQGAYNKESKGTQVSVDKTPEELAKILATIEGQIHEAGLAH